MTRRPLTSPSQPANLLAALMYAGSFNWPIFPLYECDPQTHDCACPRTSSTRDASGRCGNAGKHPRTRRGYLDATTDRLQIEDWWKNAPHANIGGATGTASGLVALDVDPRNGGDENLSELLSAHGPLPDAPTALTGGGGRHIIFRRPDTPNRVVGHPLARGVDVKADGGYIVLAPSIHVSGRAYAWELTATLRDVRPPDLPAWIAERLVEAAQQHHQPSTLAVTAGFLGAAFAAAGWLGHGLGPDKSAARCPWEDAHTTGSRFDSSTIVYAPAAGKRLGAFYCAHEHCRGRTWRDVLAQIPESARAAASDALSLDDDALEAESSAPATDSASDATWRRALRYTEDRRLTKDPGNVTLLLSHLPEWAGTLVYDEFADEIEWARPAPPVVGLSPPAVGARLAEHDTVYVQHWLALHHGVSFPTAVVADAIRGAARENRRHLLRDYLAGLQWDRTPRVSRWLSTYLGADASTYSQTVGRLWLISAVARVFRPGCQADHLLILEGEQGGGKSSAARILAGDAWHCGSLPDLRSKDAALQLQGTWICEIGELDAFRGASGTRVKDFVTQPIDTYRPPYERCSVRRPRQCVFLGTTNDAHYLRDVTGARRFWPVAVRVLDRTSLIRDRDQLWAEARYLFDSGEPWWPQGGASTAEISAEQDQRYDADEWETLVERYCSEVLYADPDAGVAIGEILERAISIKPDKWTRGDQMRVAACLRRIGWEKPGRRAGDRSNGSRLWYPRRQPLPDPPTCPDEVGGENLQSF